MAENKHRRRLSRLDAFAGLCISCIFFVLTVFVYVVHWTRPETLLEGTFLKDLPLVWARAIVHGVLICFTALMSYYVFREYRHFRGLRQSGNHQESSILPHADETGVSDQEPGYTTPLDLVQTVIFFSFVLLLAMVLVLGSTDRAESWGKYAVTLFLVLMALLMGVNAANGIKYGKLRGKHRVCYKADDPEAFRRDLVLNIFFSIAFLAYAAFLLLRFF
jgi:hypothetical protein